MKKILAVLLIVSLVFCFAACNNRGSDDKGLNFRKEFITLDEMNTIKTNELLFVKL